MLNCEFDIGRKSNTTEMIVGRLTDLIKEKSLKPGDKLPPERELAALMQVSRPSLREALKALQMMNIIDIRQGSGTFVKSLGTESVVEHLDIVFTLDNSLYNDLYSARRVLESSIARIAAACATEGYLAQMRRNIEEGARNLDNPEAFLRLDLELHNLVLRMADNRVLSVFMQSIANLNLMLRKKTNSSRAIREKAVEDHQRLLCAFEAGDAEAAALAMEEHLSNIQVGFSDLTRENGEKDL